MGCPTFNPPGPRKDSALCPDVISKSLLLRLSTPLPSHPGSRRWAAIGRAPPRPLPPLLAPVPKSLRGASVIDLTLVRCCFPFPAPTFNSVYCFYVSPAYYCVQWQEHNKRQVVGAVNNIAPRCFIWSQLVMFNNCRPSKGPNYTENSI